MSLDPLVLLMKDGPERQVTFQIFKRLFNLGQLDVKIPEPFSFTAALEGAQQILSLPASHLPEFVPLDREGERVRTNGFILAGKPDLHQPVGLSGFLFGGSHFDQ